MEKKTTKKKKPTTIKQKDAEIKSLKEKLANLASYVREIEKIKEGGEHTHLAIGCSKKENGDFCLDFIKYNPETKQAIVEKSEEVKPNPKQFHALSLNLGKIAELEVIKNVEGE